MQEKCIPFLSELFALVVFLVFSHQYLNVGLRKQGKLEERKPFMLLFDDVAIDYILSAAQ